MAIEITKSMTTKEGNSLSAAYVRVRKIEDFNEASIRLQLRMWIDEAAYDANKESIWVDEIPDNFQNLNDTLTTVQYANVDNDAIQTKIAALMEQGDSHTDWAQHFGELVWAGLGTTTCVAVMPT